MARPWAPSPDQGRFAQAAYVVQRAFDHATLSASVFFGVNPVFFRALLKLALIVANVAALAAVLANIRAVAPGAEDRRTVALSSSARRAVLSVFPLVLLIGAKATLGTGKDTNGWVDYPLLTLTGAVLVLGIVACFLLTLSRWSNWGHLKRTAFQGLSMVVAGLLVVSYELFYLVVPAVAIAIALQADGSRRWGRAWWGRRLALSLPFFLAFTAGFVVTRWYATAACAEDACYAGLTLSLGPETARAILYSIASSLPGGIASEVAEARVMTGAFQVEWRTLTALSVLLGLAVCAIAWLLACRATRTRGGEAEPVDGVADRRLLTVFAACAIGFGLASAAVTPLSLRGQTELTQVGLAFRSGPMTWSLLAAGLVCIGVVAARSVSNRGEALQWVAGIVIVVGAAVTTASTWATNLDAQRVDKSYGNVQLVRMVHDEVVYGRTDIYADADRCELMSRVYESSIAAKSRVTQGAHNAFLYYYDVPFCSQKTSDFADPLERN